MIEIHIMDNSLYMPRGVKIVTNNKEAEEVLSFWIGFPRELAYETGRDDLLKQINSTETVKLAKASWPFGSCTLAPDIVLTFKMAGHWQQDFLEKEEIIIPVKKGKCCSVEKEHQLATLWNGDAILCCFDYNGRTRFANLNETTLYEVDQQARRLRNQLILGGDIPLTVCRRCLGIKIKRLGDTTPFSSADGEVPVSRVAVFGKDLASVNLMDTLQGGGIEVSCFLKEKRRVIKNVVKQKPVYYYHQFPEAGIEAVLFPPEWKKDENIIREMVMKYPHLLLGQVDLVALNPFGRKRLVVFNTPFGQKLYHLFSSLKKQMKFKKAREEEIP